MTLSILRIILLIYFYCLYLPSSVDGQAYIVKGLDLLGGKDKVSLPFDIEQGFIIVDVRMQRTFPMRFIFDTGAEHTIIFNKAYTDMLRIPYDKREVPIVGADLQQEMKAKIVRNVYMEMQGARPVSRDMLVLKENYLRLFETAGIRVDGIMGGEFFRNLILEIDYKKRKIHLYNPDRYSPVTDKKFKKFDLDIINFKPYMKIQTISLGDTAELKVLVDTGAALSFLLHNNSHPSLTLPDFVLPGNLGTGLGGDIKGYIGLIDRIDIGPYEFNRVLASFQELDDSMLRENEYIRNGLIGNILLSRFHVIIDYNKGAIYLKARRNYNKDFEYDKSGITIFSYGPDLNQFFIRGIVPNSPADLAGLQVDDEILKVSGKNARKWDLHKVSKYLQRKPGKKAKLTIRRGEELHKFEFKLRDLLLPPGYVEPDNGKWWKFWTWF